MDKYKIGIWGQYGDGGKIADGQAVRTTIITQELQNKYGKENVCVVNTNNWRKHPVKFLWRSFRLVANSRKVAIAPADNGFKVFVPLLMFFNFFYRRKLIDIVIGGYLPALIDANPSYKKMLNKFDACYVQTENIRKDLEDRGIKNIHMLTNLKRLHTRKVEDIILNTEKEIKLCVFSRIYKDKGVEDAIEAVKLANAKLGGQYITLDFYGLLPKKYEERLAELLKENVSFLKYHGIVEYDKTVETLTPYFAMLFPTYYHGEGFPGNFVDAFNTGLPVIATDWLYNKDLIKDGENGLLIPIKNPEALCDAILKLYNDRQLHQQIALNNLKKAADYGPDAVLKDFYEFIEK